MDPAQLAHSGSPLPSSPHDVIPVSQTPTKADVDEVMVLPTQSYPEVPFREPLNEIHKESPGTFTNEQIGKYPTLTQFYVSNGRKYCVLNCAQLHLKQYQVNYGFQTSQLQMEIVLVKIKLRQTQLKDRLHLNERENKAVSCSLTKLHKST